jgi:hypothetical protein
VCGASADTEVNNSIDNIVERLDVWMQQRPDLEEGREECVTIINMKYVAVKFVAI